MTLDLKTVSDHPATLLERGFPKPKSDNDNGPDLAAFVGASMAAHWMGKAAGALRQYEDTNNVTFAALDNDALDLVREAYEDLAIGDEPLVDALELARAIDALLGLDI